MANGKSISVRGLCAFNNVSIAHNYRAETFLPFAFCHLPCLCLAAPPPLEELKSEARVPVYARRTFTQQMVDELGFQGIHAAKYSWKTTAQQVLEIYREIAK